MAKKKMTVTLHIGREQIDTLTDEQRSVAAKRVSESMSRYYSANPEEYSELKEQEKKWQVTYSPDKERMLTATVEAEDYTKAYLAFMLTHADTDEIAEIIEI